MEQTLYDWYVFVVKTGEWGPYEALTPTEKMVIWLRWLWGGGLWVSNGLMVWSIFDLGGGVVCLINLFVFQPRRASMYQFLIRWVS